VLQLITGSDLRQASVTERPVALPPGDGVPEVPFSASFKDHPVIERAVRLRHNPIAAFGTAVAVIAAATLARWLLDGQVVEGVPFIT
jgi:hypothetical protein